MKRLNFTFLLTFLLTCLLLSGCGQNDPGQTPPALQEPPASSQDQPTTADETEQTATLYIGSGETFREFPFTYTEVLTPKLLISGIAELTGWDLSLADDVTVGSGGMTVCFSKNSSLFTGPPEPQNEDFFVYDSEDLVATILDSIKHTLQYNFVDPDLGDPSTLDIYFIMEGDTSIQLPEENIIIPLDQPYNGLPIAQ